MTILEPVPPPPSVLGIPMDVWGLFFRHQLTLWAGVLAAHGALATPDIDSSTMQIAVAILTYLLVNGWSWLQKLEHRR